MDGSKIQAEDLRALVRGVAVAFSVKCEKPDVFGNRTDDIDKAADALVSIRATLTDDEVKKAVFGEGGT